MGHRAIVYKPHVGRTVDEGSTYGLTSRIANGRVSTKDLSRWGPEAEPWML